MDSDGPWLGLPSVGGIAIGQHVYTHAARGWMAAADDAGRGGAPCHRMWAHDGGRTPAPRHAAACSSTTAGGYAATRCDTRRDAATLDLADVGEAAREVLDRPARADRGPDRPLSGPARHPGD